MNSMSRQIAKARGKGGEDSAKVSVLLNDFEDADNMLTKIMEASKAWRDAWVSILNIQLGTVTVFEELYDPIVGASDGHGHDPIITPQEQLERTTKLKNVYADLKTDLLEEVVLMDSRIIRPAGDAREFLQPLRKTIKKRENKRIDWERYIDKVNSLQTKKVIRSDRENVALAKAEEELSRASDAFKVADEGLRQTLPPIIAAAFSIIPHLLAVQIMIQNTLLAQYYTALHNYAEENGFQSPSPPMNDVISVWNADFKPIQEQIERINCLARGRTVHQPMALGNDPAKHGSITGLGLRNGISNRRATSQSKLSEPPLPNPEPRMGRMPSPNPQMRMARTPSPNPQMRMARIPSSNSMLVSAPPAPEPAGSANTQLSRLLYASHTGVIIFRPLTGRPSGDYFQRSAAAKKKPPPPPPKRIGSQNSGLFVTALYAFEGQNQGDLSFREGDQIKIIKKTDSTDDWWDGELRGRKGAFPANYCEMA
ncbi:Regulator of cytoskeleton and endocytosis [Lachnellula hyalina]|uniref:Regulator of cytoskeleton and endocytosis n=1 Tax=Lachnellula hyalina TaxID=1316788 RepID=A0A8H8TX81_9HELO|nr:Regulator of cytoskeleton and endocytosis [Lachnellula hyalina]TVY25719.1 Regulator of cytoskeleton and endocytosis [Lachnellula hyalina]